MVTIRAANKLLFGKALPFERLIRPVSADITSPEDIDRIIVGCQVLFLGLLEWKLFDKTSKKVLRHYTIRVPSIKHKNFRRILKFSPKIPWTVPSPLLGKKSLWYSALHTLCSKDIVNFYAKRLYGGYSRCSECGDLTIYDVCVRCQYRIIRVKFKEWSAQVEPRFHKEYFKRSFLPYFFTGDIKYQHEQAKFPYVTVAGDPRLTLLPRIVQDLDRVVSVVTRRRFAELKTILEDFETADTRWSSIRLVTPIPIRTYFMVYDTCAVCGTHMDVPEYDDPEWFDGAIVCDSCASVSCPLCGETNAFPGVCLKCFMKLLKAKSETKDPRLKPVKSYLLSAYGGFHRMTALRPGFLNVEDSVREIRMPKLKRCKRCGDKFYYLNKGYCYSCRVIAERKGEFNGREQDQDGAG